MFSGFPEETIRFFLDIRFHNEVSFYKAHEDEYQTFVKKPFYSLIEELGETMLSISDDLEVRRQNAWRAFVEIRALRRISPPIGITFG